MPGTESLRPAAVIANSWCRRILGGFCLASQLGSCSPNRYIGAAAETSYSGRLANLETETGSGLSKPARGLRLGMWRERLAVTWSSSTYLDK
jgi:hypothetical protein